MTSSWLEKRLKKTGTPAAPKPPEVSARVQADDFIVKRILANPQVKKSDVERICRLPISQPLTEEESEAVQLMHVKPQAYADGFRLTKEQAEAIQVFSETGSLFAPIGVGGGKTLISLRCVGIATEAGVERILLCVPPQVYSQLINHDIAQARRWVPLGCSFYLMGGKTPARRKQLAGGRRGCWVMPYSLLSRPDSYALLEAIRPQLIIFDEAHALKNRGAARTKRVLSYVKAYQPRVVALSGTMTSKSLNDYAHLLQMTLGEGAPVPLETQQVQEWAATLDSEQRQTQEYYAPRTGSGPLRPLIHWSNLHFPATRLNPDVPGFRAAFQNRLLTTPGVVASPSDSLGTSLIIENHKPGPMSGELRKHIDRLNNEWVTPSGDELEHAMMVWKWNWELSAGVYNALVWPDPEHLMRAHGYREDEARRILKQSQDYHEALQAYHKELRTWFRTRPHRPGMDTPMTVAATMARSGSKEVGEVLFRAWEAKNELDFKLRVARIAIPTRVSDYKLQKAIEWAKAQETGGIVWYWHQDLGRWAFEMFEAAGLPAIHCHAGNRINRMLTDENAATELKGKFLICSIAAHGTGKNLQYLQNQIFLQLPASEQLTEQAIGRTHRKGQEADEVIVGTMVTTDYDQMHLGSLLNDAIYVRETMNSPRKLLVAAWNPMPIVYGSQVLIRAGAQAKMLNARQQQMLMERFQKHEE